MFQSLAVEKLHGDKALAVALINFVNGADAGMVQCRCGASFPAESLQRRSILGNLGRKKLQGHEPAEIQVLGLVDHTHAPAADLFQDPVPRNSTTDDGRRISHSSVILRHARQYNQSGWTKVRGPLANTSGSAAPPFVAENIPSPNLLACRCAV